MPLIMFGLVAKNAQDSIPGAADMSVGRGETLRTEEYEITAGRAVMAIVRPVIRAAKMTAGDSEDVVLEEDICRARRRFLNMIQ